MQNAPTKTPRAHRAWQLFAALAAAGLVASFLILWVMTEVHEEILKPQFLGMDYAILKGVHRFVWPPLTFVMRTLSLIGAGTLPFTAVAVLWVWLLWQKMWRESAGIFVAAMGAGLMNVFLKLRFARARPDETWALAHEKSFSFPSGHAMMSIIVYGMMTYLICRRLQNPRLTRIIVPCAALMIFSIGLSRVYLVVHFPSDILAGFVAGGVWLSFSILATEALYRFYPLPPAPPRTPAQ